VHIVDVVFVYAHLLTQPWPRSDAQPARCSTGSIAPSH
jgi:hypothetical protein